MNSTFIIAEMAWAHDGSIEKSINIMNAAKDSGADAISIHLTELSTYMVPHYGSGEGRVSAGRENMEVYKYLDDININNDDWKVFCEAARKKDIKLCIMPNDMNSLQFCEKNIEPDFYVLSAAAFVEKEFITAVAKTERQTIFRVGGATIGEIENAVNIFKDNNGGEVTLLHGFQNYPTKLEDTNLLQMRSLKALFGVPVGLADHIDGSDPLAKVVPAMSIALGASVIEKHITWNRDEKGEDFEAALNPADFKEFVSYVRGCEIALGQECWGQLSDATKRYRDVSRKRMVAARDIKSNKVIERDDITFKRADVGISPADAEYVIGRTAKVDLNENDGITLGDLL